MAGHYNNEPSVGRDGPAAVCAAPRWRKLFANGDASDLKRYRLAERLLARGQRVFTQGEPADCVYLLLKGWLALERVLPDGQRQIVDFALPGSIVGHHQDEDGAAPHSADCLTDCWLVVFKRARFMEMLRDVPAASALYELGVLGDLERAHDALSNIARRSGAEKVAHLVVQLMDRMIAAGAQDDPRRLPVTQNHLAAALGITNVYISRVVKSLRAEGLIAWRQNCLHVLDAEALRAVADLD